MRLAASILAFTASGCILLVEYADPKDTSGHGVGAGSTGGGGSASGGGGGGGQGGSAGGGGGGDCPWLKTPPPPPELTVVVGPAGDVAVAGVSAAPKCMNVAGQPVAYYPPAAGFDDEAAVECFGFSSYRAHALSNGHLGVVEQPADNSVELTAYDTTDFASAAATLTISFSQASVHDLHVAAVDDLFFIAGHVTNAQSNGTDLGVVGCQQGEAGGDYATRSFVVRVDPLDVGACRMISTSSKQGAPTVVGTDAIAVGAQEIVVRRVMSDASTELVRTQTTFTVTGGHIAAPGDSVSELQGVGRGLGGFEAGWLTLLGNTAATAAPGASCCVGTCGGDCDPPPDPFWLVTPGTFVNELVGLAVTPVGAPIFMAFGHTPANDPRILVGDGGVFKTWGPQPSDWFAGRKGRVLAVDVSAPQPRAYVLAAGHDLPCPDERWRLVKTPVDIGLP